MKSINKKKDVNSSDNEDTDSYFTSSETSKDGSKFSQNYSQQFSVLRTDPNSLRMKISAVRDRSKFITNAPSANNNNDIVLKNSTEQLESGPLKVQKTSQFTPDSSSCCSDSESNQEANKKNHTKLRKTRIKKKKLNNGCVGKKSCNAGGAISTDSEGEGYNKDFNFKFEKRKEKVVSPRITSSKCLIEAALPAESVSSNDAELPALVDAAIKCVESSDGDCSGSQPPQQYTSSLLHDFMIKTQMLGTLDQKCDPEAIETKQDTEPTTKTMQDLNESIKSAPVVVKEEKKRRGRPKKKPLTETSSSVTTLAASPATMATIATPNTSTAASATSTLLSISKPKVSSTMTSVAATSTSVRNRSKSVASRSPNVSLVSHRDRSLPKHSSVVSLDKEMYATERVLYPPKNRKKRQDATAGSAKHYSAEVVDPLWKKIDVNSKFRRPDLSGYKSDGGGGTVCSKILAAQSGYVSDYPSVSCRGLSGYKSDASGKSRYSSKSVISRSKSCIFQSDGGRSMRKLRKKHKFLKQSNSFCNVIDQDILQLAGLTLGHSGEDSSRESTHKQSISMSKKMGEINRFVTTGEYFGQNMKRLGLMGNNDLVVFGDESCKKSTSVKEAKSIYVNSSIKYTVPTTAMLMPRSSSSTPQHKVKSSDSVSKLHFKMRPRRSSAVSRCSSVSYASEFCTKRRSRKFFRKMQNRLTSVDSKLNTEIELMTDSFTILCSLTNEKNLQSKDKLLDKEKGIQSSKICSRRNVKKKKMSENGDCVAGNSNSKRRHKRTNQQSPDDHKLPLKKRHYLLTPGEKPESKLHFYDLKSAKDSGELNPHNMTNFFTKVPSSKALTPKKRHLLDTENISENVNSTAKGSGTHSFSYDQKPTANVLNGHHSSYGHHHKSETNTNKKKNRLEDLVSKIQSTNLDIPSEIPHRLAEAPPPGVFEPSVELEIQIPVSKIVGASFVTKCEKDSPSVTEFDAPTTSKSEKVVESLLNKTGGMLVLKKKRRKAINRTGFPSIKKRKKKLTHDDLDSSYESEKKSWVHVTPQQSPTPVAASSSPIVTPKCDRVPHSGETSATFLERSIKRPRLSVVSLDRLQNATQVDEKKPTETKTGEKPKKMEIAARNKKGDVLTVNGNKRKLPGEDKNKIRKPTVLLNRLPCVIKLNTSATNKVAKSSSQTDGKNSTNKTKSTTAAATSKATKPVAAVATPSKSVATPKKAATSKQSAVETPSKSTPKKGTEKTPRGRLSGRRSTSNKVAAVVKDEANKSSEAIGETKTTYDNAIDSLEQEPLPNEERSKAARNASPQANKLAVNKRKVRIKKTYLLAGLFSESYKASCKENKKQLKSVGSADPAEQIESVGESSITTTTSLLPHPPYCDNFFRRSVYDFQLPYDIWLAYENAKLPNRITVPSWNYKKIRTNIYGDVRPNLGIDHQPCNCTYQSGCGDDCLNRMVYTECSPTNCPCDDKCLNQKIQKHEVLPGVERFMTENKGWGVRTNVHIKKGTYILEYVGEVVTEKEFKERMATLYVNDNHHYCLNLDGGLVIDGHRMGSDGRFVNHSCSPNCEMQKWSVNGLFRMALFAARNIDPGEELTYDYNFALFNPSEGQPCRCETPQCRGVIGGKSQRVKPKELSSLPAPVKQSRVRKRLAKKSSGKFFTKEVFVSNFQIPTEKEKKIVKESSCFLIRNLQKVQKAKVKGNKGINVPDVESRPATPSSIAAQLSALRVPRNVKTRALLQASNDPEMEKIAKMASILRQICFDLENKKDASGKSLLTKLVPATKKRRLSNDRWVKPLDFPTVQSNIQTGLYKEPNSFDKDIRTIFNNALTFFGPNSPEAFIVDELVSFYVEKKNEAYDELVKLFEDKQLLNFRPNTEKEQPKNSKSKDDIIRCICGLYRDEGLMIQCSKCLVWQHAECTKADIKADNYLCERCLPRKIDLEISLDEFTEEGYRYYLSLLRGDLQVRLGDAIYVLRDIPIKDENGVVVATKKHTYETIGDVNYYDCDIFRIERLWKDNQGKRFVYGHHYLRPHETFHEPTRRFYTNEVIRVPLYEVVPIELVMARCWVLDKSTFCKGRPIDCTSEEHIYICELRVDKSARFFSKVKQTYPVCTKEYAFKYFDKKLQVTRTYAPHEVDPSLIKPKKRKQHEQQTQTKKVDCSMVQITRPSNKTISDRRIRLEHVITSLKLKQNCDTTIDLTYLLTGRGARQRKANNIGNVPTPKNKIK